MEREFMMWCLAHMADGRMSRVKAISPAAGGARVNDPRRTTLSNFQYRVSQVPDVYHNQ
jgi:hypothetical protein